MSFVVLDTDVSSASLRGRLADPLRARLTSQTWCISFVTVGARAERRGRPRPVNDTWIAASCLVRDLPLATLNIKDFSDFADHDGLRIIGVNER